MTRTTITDDLSVNRITVSAENTSTGVTVTDGTTIDQIVVATDNNDIAITISQSAAGVESVNGQTGDVVLTTTNIAEGTNEYYTQAKVDARVSAGITGKVNKSGDTMTGALILNADPVTNLGAATKQYVDGAVNNSILLSTDDLAEGTTNLYYTNTRADARVAIGVANLVDSAPGTLDTLNELAAALGDDANFATTVTNSIATKLATADFNTTFDTRLATKTTTNLTEGTNLYYTTARQNTDFDTRLATKTTTNLTEGTNLYFTDQRVKDAIGGSTAIINPGRWNSPYTENTYLRGYIQWAASGGTNLNIANTSSLNDNTTLTVNGWNTHTNPIQKWNSTGSTVASISQAGVLTANSLNLTTYPTTTNITEGTNLYYTDVRARASNSAGTGVTYDSATGVISIGQDVATTANPTFAGATLGNVTVGVATDQTITTSTGDLVLNSTSGTITMSSNGTLGFTLEPITGFNPNADFTGNIVKGTIRTGAGKANGSIYEFLGAANPSVGVSIDNADKVTARTSLVMRNYGGLRNTTMWEQARGTVAVPTNVLINDSLGEIQANGYTSAGWSSDLVATPSAVIRLRARENWSNGINNVGTQLLVVTQPTATALSGSSLVATFINDPANTNINSNTVTINQGKNTTTGGAVLQMGGPGTVGGGGYLQVGDVNIAQMNSSWQTTYSPGFKYTGLMSSSTQTGSGSYFEMSSRWKAAAADTAYVIPQDGWGLGRFGFSADNTTTSTGQVNAGAIQSRATENWSSTATGSKLLFTANKQGLAFAERPVLDMSPETINLTSNVVNLYNTNNSGTPYGNVSIIRSNAGDPAGASFNDRTSQLRVTTASTSAGDASTIVFATNNFNVGTNTYSPSVAGDTLGEFFFSGNYASGGGTATLGPSVRFAAKAAETFTSTNSGGRFFISVDKIGGNVQYDAITIDSANANIASDTITLESNTGTDYLTLNSTQALFSKPIRQLLQTATVARGGTYTLPANDLNVNSLTITSGTAAVTYIDVDNVASDATSGGMYSILIYNNSGDNNIDVQVRNNGANIGLANNLDNGDRAMASIYVVDGYAACEIMDAA